MTVDNMKALEVWTAQTLCDAGILLSIVSLLLHLGRPYFDRILARLPLRVAADIWWMIYVLLRDGTLFLAVLIGFWHLNLDLMADIKVGLPFVPFATVFLSAALYFKVFRNSEDLNGSFKLVTWLVMAGAVLNAAGYVLVMEGPGEEYSVAKAAFWRTMDSWKSNANPALATVTFFISMSAMTILFAISVVKGFRLFDKASQPDTEEDECSMSGYSAKGALPAASARMSALKEASQCVPAAEKK